MITETYLKRWNAVEAGGFTTVLTGGPVGVYNTHRTTGPKANRPDQSRMKRLFEGLVWDTSRALRQGLAVSALTTAQQRMQAREAILRWHRKIRPLRTRCGATRKHDGQPCQQIAMANGRCSYHGGRTPKSDAWHKPRWPNGAAPDAEKKLARKLKDQARTAKKRAARLAAMSPEERERHETWQRSHRPGSAAMRAARRQARDQAAQVAAVMAKSAPIDPAVGELQRRVDELKRRIAMANDVFS